MQPTDSLSTRILCLTFAIGFSFNLATKGSERPNIVFLMSDDQTTFSMGCYGNRDVLTPNLDQLAREGIVFDNHYATTAICMASRATAMTGMFEYKTGCNFEHGALLQEHWRGSYPVLLRQSGYRTGFAGKFGFLVAEQPTQKGQLPIHDFDAWGGSPGQTSYRTAKNESMVAYAKDYPHSTLAYGAFGRDFIRDAASSAQPFCLSISFKAPHKPATPDPRFDSVYRDKKFVKPGNFGREYGSHFSLQSRQGRQYERFHSWGYADDYDSVMATYHQQIHAIDVSVGMIRRARLMNLVSKKKTVVIYTSDNGFMCGSHGYGSKVLPYEESARVPLIIFDPRTVFRTTPARCESLTGNVDVAPTILDLAGINAPENMDGKSMVQLCYQPKSSIHETLPLINVWGPKKTYSLAVVTRDWKYIHWPFDQDGMKATEELYDTKNDPLERTNLVVAESAANELFKGRSRYDAAVAHWQKTAVRYHNYSDFGLLFSRN